MKAKPILGFLLIILIGWAGYLFSQQPRVWINRQWAGLSLLRGGYRSWSFSFSDGLTPIDGKWQPVVIETNGYRPGYFSWPKYAHVDLR